MSVESTDTLRRALGSGSGVTAFVRRSRDGARSAALSGTGDGGPKNRMGRRNETRGLQRLVDWGRGGQGVSFIYTWRSGMRDGVGRMRRA